MMKTALGAGIQQNKQKSLPLRAFLMVQEVKNLPANTGDADSIPGSGRSPRGGNGNLLL